MKNTPSAGAGVGQRFEDRLDGRHPNLLPIHPLSGTTFTAVVLATAFLLAGCHVSHDPGGASAPDFTLVSFNMLHGLGNEDKSAQPFDRFPERFDLVTADLTFRRPDAILLQEVSLLPLPGYPDVIGTLLERLKVEADAPYRAVFGNVFGTPPVLDGGSIEGQLTLIGTPLEGEPRNRAVSLFRVVVHCRVRTPLGSVDLYNAHLSGDGDLEAATLQMEKVVAFVEETSPVVGIAVIAGDFNAEEDSSIFNRLRDAGFRDLGADSGLRCDGEETLGCTCGIDSLADPSSAANERIDYVWIRAEEGIEGRCEPIFDAPFQMGPEAYLWASDHIGLICTLRRSE